MGDMLEFYAIKVESREKAPEGVKNFIDDFFKPANVLGIDCYVAISSDHKSPWRFMDHSEYKKGLSNEELRDRGVFTWMDNHPELIFRYKWS